MMMLRGDNAELQLRHSLGIPDDAQRVLIFSESSHWDPNWLLTSDEYYQRFVQNNLDRAIEELLREPRRVYSIECMFFLRMYWERNPVQHDVLRKLVNNGRLRLTSSGVTTADTLLPSAEAILRDLLIGQEWLLANGLEQEPKLAYFTDSFGCTPALPSLLRAAGFDRTAITRIDGMYFMGCDLEPSWRFPRAGSSAERLLKHELSLDFLWRDRNGAQVLCHWNAFTYGQGDMLAYAGVSRVYLARLALPLRTDRHIARRIKGYVAQLSPLSRTPYMYCPIGFDFVEPIPDLVALLDRVNQNHYLSTGIWVVNAGLDDYLALVEPYQDELPVLELDPNPYWTGFYTTRPTLKQRCRHLVDDLLLAEKLSFLPENSRTEKTISRELEDPWWRAAVSNHHDFITGTSPDAVVEDEQIPWLDGAVDSVNTIIDRLVPDISKLVEPTNPSESVTWTQKDGRLQIKTAYYYVELDEDAGGGIVDLRTQDGHMPLLVSISNDLVSYRDSGGLWRMGLEFAGGIWRETICASQRVVRIQVHEHRNGLEISSNVELNGELLNRRIWFRNDLPLIHCRVEGKAPEGHSITLRFETGIHASKLVMDTPGGIVTRPLTKIYHPTFWSLHQFVHIQDDENGRGIAFLQPLPGAISCQPDGQIELVALRNATREKVFGLIGIPGNPASGHESENYAYEYALLFTEKGNWRDNDLHLWARNMLNSPWNDPRQAALRNLADSIVTTDTPDIWVTAIKPASQGEGIIVRLYTFEVTRTPMIVRAPYFKIEKAFLCDARERDLMPLDVMDGAVRVTMPGTVATIRLLPGFGN